MKKYNAEEKEAIRRCNNKWEEIKKELGNGYVQIKSCNKDISRYLVPKGSEDEISYYGKPELSYRLSDHWNWYSNTKRCKDETYIQCYSEDLLPPLERNGDGKASNPIFAISIGMFVDGVYKIIFGDRFNFETNEWEWVE